MLRTIQVVLSANVSGFAAQMGTASAVVRQLGNEAHATALRTDTASKRTLTTVGKLSLAVGVGLAAAWGLSIRAAANFEAEMRNVSSISEATQRNFDTISDSILDMSRQMPQSAAVMAKGMYDITSSGFDGAEALTVLKVSGTAASAGLTDTATAARATTAVLNAYGKSGFEASHVSDILFSTVKLGVVSYEQLASSVGDYIGTARAANLTLEDTHAALATMTLSGVSAAESGTSLNRVIQSFIDPSEEMTAALKELGYETGADALAADGLHGVMGKLQAKYEDNITALQALFPEQRALRGALALTADDGDTLVRIYGDMTDKTKVLGATQAAYTEQSKSASFQWEIAKNNVTAMAIELGTMLLPALTTILEFFAGFVGGLSEMSDGAKWLILGLGGLATVLALVGGAFLVLAPRIAAAQAAMVSMSVTAPLLARGIGMLPGILGGLGLALTVATILTANHGKATQEARRRTDEFVTALLAEQDGLQGEIDVLIANKLAKSNLIDVATRLGVSLDLVSRAAHGDAAALDELLLSMVRNGGEHGKLYEGVNQIATAFAAAQSEVRQQDVALKAMNPSASAAADKMGDLGGATDEAGQKFADLAVEIGISGAALRRMAHDSETEAARIRDAVTGAMDATRSTFMDSFDSVSRFSRSSWESMTFDAHSGAGGITDSVDKIADAELNLQYTQERLAERTAEAYASMEADVVRATDGILAAEERLADSKRDLIELQERQAESDASEYERLQADVERSNDKVLNSEERLFDARQNLTDLQERQAQDDKLTLSDRQAMERATRAVERAEADLAESRQDAADAQARLDAGVQQSVSERQQLERAQRSIEEADKALIKSHKEAEEAQRLLNEGVKLGVSDHQELERAQRAVIEAQTGMVSTASGAKEAVGSMGEEVEKFFATSIAEAQTFLANVHEAIDRGLDPRYVSELLQAGPHEAGPILETILGDHSGRMIAMANEFMDLSGSINTEAAEMARLTQLAVSSSSDTMVYDLRNAMRIAQLEMANGGRLSARELSRELDIGIKDVERILDSFFEGKLPGSAQRGGENVKQSWRNSLKNWPEETFGLAQETSDAFTGPIGGLAPWAQLAGETTKNAWLEKLDVAATETGTKSAAWAKNLLDNLNPILLGVGGQAIGSSAGSGAAGAAKGVAADYFAAGGIVERHDPQIAQGGPVRIWNEPELPWEGYVSGDPAKKGRSVAVMKELAKRLGLVVVERAEGGVDEFGLPMPPVLASLWGSMMGGTTDAGTGHTYAAAKAWMASHGGMGAAGGAAGPMSPAPPGSVTDWVRQAAMITGVGETWVDALYRRAMYESSGDPHAINLWDINAINGTPSKGLMQTIDSTFQGHKIPGYDDIWNPVHNTIAAIRYIQAAYGSIFAIDPPISGYRGGGIVDFVSMDRGGTLGTGFTLVHNGTGGPEQVAGPGQRVVSIANSGEMSSMTSTTGAQGLASSYSSVTPMNGANGAAGYAGGRPAGLDMGIGSAATSVDNSTSISFAPVFDVDAQIAPGMDVGAIARAVERAMGSSKDEMWRELRQLLAMHARGRGRR